MESQYVLWFALGGMLLVGSLFRVGLYMFSFSLAALVTALLSLATTDLNAQLQSFLLLSLVAIAVGRYRRRYRGRQQPGRF